MASKQPADSKQLESEVKEAVKDAAKEAKTGNVETVEQKPDDAPYTGDLPTGARSHYNR